MHVLWARMASVTAAQFQELEDSWEISMAQQPLVGRAVWFDGPRQAALRTEAIASPAGNEILVRSIHSLVSAGSEIALYKGEGNLPDLLLPTARGTLPFPVKFAYQTVGEVLEAGADSGYAPGDKVFAGHPHQDVFTIAAGMCNRIPDDIDPLRAQFAGMFGVAHQVHLQCPVRPGEIVAISGLGLIGQFAAFLARLSAGRLILIDPLALRRQQSAWIGADAVVGPEDAAEAIAALSGELGVDKFIETSGAPPALQTAIDNTATLGTIAVPAWYGTRPVHLSLSPQFHLRSLKIVSIHSFNLDEDNRWDQPRKFRVAFDFLRLIDVNPLISHRIPFERAPEAYRLLAEHPETAMAVLLTHNQAHVSESS